MNIMAQQPEDSNYVQRPYGQYYITPPSASNNTHVGQDLAELRQQLGGDTFEMNSYKMVTERKNGEERKDNGA